MDDAWYIHTDGTQHGPYVLADVFDLIDRGQVPESAWFACGDVRVDRPTLLQRWPDPRIKLEAIEPDGENETELTMLPESPPMSLPTNDSEPTPATNVTEPPATPPVDRDSDDEPPPPSVPHPAQAPPAIERDCVLILGRRRAGKTVYLATLYSMLWKSSGGLTMKALSGATHKALTGVVDQLKHGQWPEATLGSRRMEFELSDDGRKRLLVAVDYSGEDFKRAFVDEDYQSPEVKKLLHYLDRAMAVILLMDPSVATEGKSDEAIDDDFGMVQAIERLRNWPGGEEVPVVLAMTKADRNKQILLEAGTMREFVQRHYPAILRVCPKLSIFAVSAVQEQTDEHGKRLPRQDSAPVNLEKPLRHCLKQLRRRETAKQRQERENAIREAELEQLRQEDEHVQATNRKAAFLVAAILIVGMCICALIWFLAD